MLRGEVHIGQGTETRRHAVDDCSRIESRDDDLARGVDPSQDLLAQPSARPVGDRDDVFDAQCSAKFDRHGSSHELSIAVNDLLRTNHSVPVTVSRSQCPGHSVPGPRCLRLCSRPGFSGLTGQGSVAKRDDVVALLNELGVVGGDDDGGSAGCGPLQQREDYVAARGVQF